MFIQVADSGRTAKIDEIERQMMELRYLIQDLDSQISQMDIPEAQISSARQLADLNEKKKALIEKRELLCRQSTELEKRRQIALQEREKTMDQQHKESTRLGRIAAWSTVASIVVAVILAAMEIWVQIALK